MSLTNSHATSRPDGIQATVQVPSTDTITYNRVVEYVKLAIKGGNKLPNPDVTRPEHDSPNRKALIIAPLYQEPERPRKFALPSTAHDVKLVHEVLIASGYNPKNIRILCDVCKGFNGLADPTKENIMDSLEWLVHETRQGDYRFLYFSGHGLRNRASVNDGKRKEARLVPMSVDNDKYSDVEADDFELNRRLHPDPKQPPERRTRQKVPKADKIMYYKEAIMTRISEPRDDEDQENASIIWDNELNDYLSTLHAESTITCVMDCCASGRILNLPDKALGAGFRGGSTQPVAQPNNDTIQRPSAPSVNQLNNPIVNQSDSPSLDEEFNLPGSYPLPAETEPEDTVWVEDIPEQERRLNGVKANIFHWSGCHQRQNCHNLNTGGCTTGMFTRAFTRTYTRLKSTDGPTHKALYEEVSKEVNMAAAGIPRPQFVQLWTV